MERLYKSPVEPRLTVLTISGYLTWEKVAFSARKNTREVNKELLRQRNKKTMPVASLFLLCTWEKVTFPLNAASINLMATGCVLNRYPSRAIIELWPHWHAISGLVSCKGNVRRLSDVPRPYCLADPGACCEPRSKIRPQKAFLSCRSR